MKRNLITIALGAAIALMSGITAQASPATLSNIAGGAPPTPGPYDAYMLDNETYYSEAQANQEPVSSATLNYYSNGGGGGYFPGQIFTTPALPAGAFGFRLASVTVNEWGGDGGGITTSPQDYTLVIYSVAANTPAVGEFTVTPIASYTSQPYEITDEYFMTFVPTGAGVALLGSTEYCFTVQNDGGGWVEMMAEPTLGNTGGTASSLVAGDGASSEYNATGFLIDPNDMAVLAPIAGGVIYTYDEAPTFQADFDVGLTPITFAVNPVTIDASTPGNIYQTPEPAYALGTAVMLDCGSILGGTAPFTYQWQVSYSAPGANTAGAFTDIGGPTSSSTLTTTPAVNGYYQYQAIVTDSTLPTPQTATASAVGLVIAPAAITASMSDEGVSYQPAGCYDAIVQTSGGGGGDNLNYYDNFTASPAGNIFFTGADNGGSGYVLTSVQLQTGNNGDTSQNTTLLQPYYLCIYQLNTAQTLATLVQQYYCPAFLFTFGDWIEFEGLSTPLLPNATYAYTFVNDNNASWAGLNSSLVNVQTTPSGSYAGGVGVACLISPQDRNVSPDTAGNSGVFVVGLTDNGVTVNCPVANGIVVSPLGSVTAGITVTLSETPSGEAPFTYTWNWDAGLGGTPSTIVPGTTANQSGSSITVNTPLSPLAAGTYHYTVTVNNSHEMDGPSVSTAVSVQVVVPTQTGVLSLLGTNLPVAGPYDIAQTEWFGANQKPDGLNYYWDNATPPGQTFITGGNSAGYILNYVDLQLAGDDGVYTTSVQPLPTNGGGFILTIYSVNLATTNATPIAIYDSQTNFVVTTGSTDTNWIQFSGLSVPLAASSTYAYSFGKVQSYPGWCCVASSSSNNPYAGGQICLIPANGGTITYESSGQYDAVFDLGLSLGSAPAPTLSIQKLGSGQVQLQWSAGVLLQAASVNGPWTTNAATSPYTLTPTGSGMFYRAQAP